MHNIAIHSGQGGFHPNWRSYCLKNNIPFKNVDCYADDIIDQLSDCDALMWHHSQNNPKDLLIAKQLLFALEHSGKVVFPDFNTNWHFDDKVAQKYLLELVQCPMTKNYVFYEKDTAINWAKNTNYPVVFKLRGGAGSFNVKLIRSFSKAKSIINKAFNHGFSNYDSISALKETFGFWKKGKVSIIVLLKSFARLFIQPEFAKVAGREVGYVYFQEFIPDNDSDIRVIVIGDKAFAIKRNVRENDFRASGSGNIEYSKKYFDEKTIKTAFDVAGKLKSQCVAFDFVYKEGKPLVIEISYGYAHAAYAPCEGYWDSTLNWYPGNFDSCEWMVDVVINDIKRKKY
jgi:glutathione synthase/RimK-type ligase-like ATP-grasp enzyme